MSIANIQYKHESVKGADIDITIPAGPSMDKWEFVGFVYNRTLTDPIDITVYVKLKEREYIIKEESGFTGNDLFHHPQLEITSPMKIRFETSGAGGSEDQSVILIYKA